jgi:hypothetical protein
MHQHVQHTTAGGQSEAAGTDPRAEALAWLAGRLRWERLLEDLHAAPATATADRTSRRAA